jgi:signal transduction histidine kinase
VLALIGGAVYSLVGLFGVNAWIRHTADVRHRVVVLRSTLLEAESGMRGYLATGAPAFLVRHDAARDRWRGQLDELRELTTDNAAQQERLQTLSMLIETQLADLAAARASRDAGQPESSLLPLLGHENGTMEAARVVLSEMEQEEERLDVARRAEATRRRATAAATFTAGGVAFFVLMTMMARQRREADERRQRAEDQHRLLEAVFAGIQDGITLQDRSGKLVFANNSAARMIGFDTPEALLAAPERTLVERFELFDDAGNPFPPERLPARTVLAGGPRQKGVLVRYRRDRTGPWRWSVVEAYPVTDAAGQVTQAINVFRDVTAERAAEERDRFLLRAVDELSSSLEYEATLAAVARLAVPTLADWCAVDVAEDGLPKRVAIAHVDPTKIAAVVDLQERYPPDPNARTGVAEVMRTGEPQLVSRIPREMLVAAAVDAEHLRMIEALDLSSFMSVPLAVGGKVLGAMTFAMAESRRIYGEAELAFARALADRAALAIENARLFREVEVSRAATTNQLIAEEHRRVLAEQQARFAETFVGMLGHDLRNPLNAITITVKLLLRGTEDERAIRAMERILSSAARMSNMVTQLLDLTRSRLAGGITIQKRAVDLGALVTEVVEELRRAHPGRTVAWTPPAPLQVPVDRDRLAQVVSNLLGNALEHGDAAHPVTLDLSVTDGAVRLTVHNEGTPIAPEVMPVLFEPFRITRGDRSRGLGLGLFITEQIVLAHGGHVEVSSTAEGGTTFQVHLPRDVKDEQSNPTER